jgi:hypothetical protein
MSQKTRIQVQTSRFRVRNSRAKGRMSARGVGAHAIGFAVTRLCGAGVFLVSWLIFLTMIGIVAADSAGAGTA